MTEAEIDALVDECIALRERQHELFALLAEADLLILDLREDARTSGR